MFLTNNDADLLPAILEGPLFNLQRILARGHLIDKSVRPPGIHASEISRCLRMAGYSLHNFKKTHNPELEDERVFNVGHSVHDLVQKRLALGAAEGSENLEIQVEVEVPCGSTPLGRELKIESSCDGIVTFLDQGVPLARIGIEIKSESPDLWKKRTKPNPEHIEQATLYMATLDLPAIWYAYINKSSGAETPFEPPFVQAFDPKAWATLRAKIERVLHATSVNDLPAVKDSFICKTCAYKPTCQGNGLLLMPKRWKPASSPQG